MSGRVHINSLLFQTRLMERRETPLLEWRDGAIHFRRGRSHCLTVHNPSLTQVGKHIMGHSRNKTTQIINESGYVKEQNLITRCNWQRLSSPPIQIRSMLKHLIDFSTLAHNLLLTDLEPFGFWPLRSELIIWAHQWGKERLRISYRSEHNEGDAATQTSTATPAPPTQHHWRGNYKRHVINTQAAKSPQRGF